MKLTRRQEEFVNKLIDLTTELQRPIHYSTLAEGLGVSPCTAYDMLCVLEEKGIVASEYQLAEGKSGPGRAERLFCPVISLDDKWDEIQEKFNGTDLSEAGLKEFIIDRIQQGEIPQLDVALDLLARIPPEGPGPLDYCLGVITVIALHLHEQQSPNTLITYLPQILPEGELDYQTHLTLFGGFAYGLMAQNGIDDQNWSQKLLEHILYYQELVQQMTAAEGVQLAQAIGALFVPLAQVSQQTETAV